MKGNAKNKGFTLVELAVVIVIIGVLAAVAVPRFLSTTETAVDAQVQATADAVRSAYSIYLAQHKGTKPSCRDLFGTVEEIRVTSNNTAEGVRDANLKLYCLSRGGKATGVQVYNANSATYKDRRHAYTVNFR
ncbi:type II secretion system protein [Oceanithermus sp.]|uniref:type II secretion system protein n=1 Tax=Oceanithermus sp. TaxID=2268145 RepID=UPI0025FAED4F|nr:type II secretion system protein [Oceanithermus sp.]